MRTIRKGMRSEDVLGKTQFNITTDGYENSCHEFNYAKIKQMIKHEQEQGWKFVFLGADIDAVEEADKLGIKSGRTVDYACDAEGTALNYEVLNTAAGAMRRCRSAKAMSVMMDDTDCFARIREDHTRRSSGHGDRSR